MFRQINMKKKSRIEEHKADIRNKLTMAITTLEFILEGKTVSKEFIKKALKGVNQAIKATDKLTEENGP